MKTIIFISALFYVVSGFSQPPVITKASWPDSNKTIYLVYNISNISLQDAGENVVWDFSDALLTTDSVLKTVYAKQSNDSVFISVYEQGHAVHLSGTPDVLKVISDEYRKSIIVYDSNEICVSYPFSYGSSVSSVFGGICNVMDNTYYAEQGTTKVEADGYGKIIFPDNKVANNILRLHTAKQYDKYGFKGDSLRIERYAFYTEKQFLPLIETEHIWGKPTNGAKVYLGERSFYYQRLPENEDDFAYHIAARYAKSNNDPTNNNLIVTINPLTQDDKTTTGEMLQDDALNASQENTLSIFIFPNPASHIIYVKHNGGNIHRIDIIGSNGYVLKSYANSMQGNTFEINIADLPAGAYYVRLHEKEKTTIKKFIKQ